MEKWLSTFLLSKRGIKFELTVNKMWVLVDLTHTEQRMWCAFSAAWPDRRLIELNAPCSASHPPDIKLITNPLSLSPTQGSRLLPSNQLKGNQIVNLNFLTKNRGINVVLVKTAQGIRKQKLWKGKITLFRRQSCFDNGNTILLLWGSHYFFLILALLR